MFILYQTASLYLLYSDYEATLDDRIRWIMASGADGVELSNGPTGILAWQPAPDVVQWLRCAVVTVHAELDYRQGCTLERLAAKLSQLPFTIYNITFHPDELRSADWSKLARLPWPVSIENMDATRTNWRSVSELQLPHGVGLTLDLAHAAECNLSVEHFRPLFVPNVVHASAPTAWYHHTPYCLAPWQPIEVPSGSPIMVLEGTVLAMPTIADEIGYVANHIQWI